MINVAKMKMMRSNNLKKNLSEAEIIEYIDRCYERKDQMKLLTLITHIYQKLGDEQKDAFKKYLDLEKITHPVT
jgi:hypothetical protein